MALFVVSTAQTTKVLMCLVMIGSGGLSSGVVATTPVAVAKGDGGRFGSLLGVLGCGACVLLVDAFEFPTGDIMEKGVNFSKDVFSLNYILELGIVFPCVYLLMSQFQALFRSPKKGKKSAAAAQLPRKTKMMSASSSVPFGSGAAPAEPAEATSFSATQTGTGTTSPIARNQDPADSRVGHGNGGGNGSSDAGTVRTIIVAGLPVDATDRELENFCRGMPGFESAKAIVGKKPRLFVLFETPELAWAAAEVLRNQPFDFAHPKIVLCTDVCKNDLEQSAMGRRIGNPSPPMDSTPASAGSDEVSNYATSAGGPATQPKTKSMMTRPAVTPEQPGTGGAGSRSVPGSEPESDTVLIRNLEAAELTPHRLREIFRATVLAVKVAPNGHCFMKLKSHADAVHAVKELFATRGSEAEVSKTSMKLLRPGGC